METSSNQAGAHPACTRCRTHRALFERPHPPEARLPVAGDSLDATLLVLLPAAAGAGIVPADLGTLPDQGRAGPMMVMTMAVVVMVVPATAGIVRVMVLGSSSCLGGGGGAVG
jgi:hypothetical protein